MFEVSSMQTIGLMALDADSTLPKSARGGVLLNGVTKYPETVESLGDFQSKRITEPGNALFWKHVDATKRGAWGSWSFAMPAEYLGGDFWQPLREHNHVDDDYKLEKVHVIGAKPKVGDKAIVVSTTGHGTHEKMAFIVQGGGSPGGSDLIAHWEPNNPPALSSIVADIKGDSADPIRRGNLDTIFRVRKISSHCSGATDVPDIGYGIMLTGNASPSGNGAGFLPVTFGDIDGLFSHMASGPLIPSFSAKHELGFGDVSITAGAITTKAYFRGSKMPFTAPLAFEEDFYPVVQNGTTPYEVHRQYDPDKKHGFICKEKKGLWREFVKIPLKETPPCEATKDRTVVDGEGNIERTYADSRVVIQKQIQSTGMYFKPRADSHLGHLVSGGLT